jgi:hypothetical protein
MPPKQIAWQYQRDWQPKPEPPKFSPLFLIPQQLEIAAIVSARHGSEETSVSRALEEAEAYRLRGIRGTQATAQSPTKQQPILTSTRDYRRLVRDIERVRNAAPTPTGSQLQSFGQGLPTSPAAHLAVIQSSTLIEYVDSAELV